jgi:hypothetical protein
LKMTKERGFQFLALMQVQFARPGVNTQPLPRKSQQSAQPRPKDGTRVSRMSCASSILPGCVLDTSESGELRAETLTAESDRQQA